MDAFTDAGMFTDMEPFVGMGTLTDVGIFVGVNAFPDIAKFRLWLLTFGGNYFSPSEYSGNFRRIPDCPSGIFFTLRPLLDRIRQLV